MIDIHNRILRPESFSRCTKLKFRLVPRAVAILKGETLACYRGPTGSTSQRVNNAPTAC